MRGQVEPCGEFRHGRFEEHLALVTAIPCTARGGAVVGRVDGHEPTLLVVGSAAGSVVPVPPADSKLLLLDTASLYFRAFYGLPDSLRAPDGTPVNAVRGLLEFITRLVEDERPTHLVCCWDDDWRPEFRVRAIPSYKAHRVAEPEATAAIADDGTGVGTEEVPDLLSPQVPLIAEALAALGIARVGVPGFEADDVIASYVHQAGLPTRVVTGDRDLFGLVDDASDVAVLYTAARGVARAELVTESVIADRYGIPGRSYSDFSILRGDPSDGLPGVRGVGEKTASSLIRDYGSLTAVRQAAEDSDPGMRPRIAEAVRGAAEYLDVAPTVVEGVRDLVLPPVAKLPTSPAAPAALDRLAADLGLGGVIARLVGVLGSAAR